jgi:hypothetical protein
MAENASLEFFSTLTKASDYFKAWWTVSTVAFQSAFMPTFEFLQARSSTSWSWFTAFNRWIQFCYIAGAI